MHCRYNLCEDNYIIPCTAADICCRMSFSMYNKVNCVKPLKEYNTYTDTLIIQGVRGISRVQVLV